MSKPLSATDIRSLEEYANKYGTPAYMKTLMLGLLPKDKVAIKATPSMGTAMHMYDKRTRRHNIYLGTKHEGINGLESEEGIFDYSLSLMVHELGHAIYTTREKSIGDTEVNLLDRLKEEEIPFALLNLAEDARIEVKMKQLCKEKSGFPFQYGWERWLATPQESANMSAEAILFAYINTENNPGFSVPKAMRVSEYYTEFCRAKDTFEVVDILVRWKKEFYDEMSPDAQRQAMENALSALAQSIREANPGAAQEPQPLSDRNLEDMEPGMLDEQELQALIDDMDASSIDISQVSPGMGDRRAPVKLEGSTNTIEECSNTEDIFNPQNPPGEIFKDEYAKTISFLRKIKSESKREMATRTPTAELNLRGLGMFKSNPNTAKLYKKKVTDNKKTAKRILMVLDLSGSMDGMPIDAQRTILLACNELTRKNKDFKVDVVGSWTKGRAEYQTIRLPANSDALLSIHTGGGEGIAHMIQKNTAFLKEKDVIVFITDGCLDSKEVSKKHIGKHLSKNTQTVGLYVGDERHYNKEMQTWFDAMIFEESVSTAIEKLVSVINGSKKLFTKNATIGTTGAKPK